MRVNKDLMESLLMVACIVLVLVGTTHFDNEQTKLWVMVGLGLLAVISGVLRYVVAPKQNNNLEMRC